MTTYDGFNSSKKFKSTYTITLNGSEVEKVRAKNKREAQKKANERFPHSNVKVN